MGKHGGIHRLSEEGLILTAKRFKALGDPKRLKLMMELSQGERSVGSLVDDTGISQANVSRHLQTLAAVGILVRRKHGASVYYRVADPGIFEFCAAMCGGLRKHLTQQARAMG